MKVILYRRADIALRSLGTVERKHIDKALRELEDINPKDFSRSRKIHRVTSAAGETLYVYRGSPQLRLVLSVHGDTCAIEDVVDHNRLDRLLFKGGLR